MFAVGWLLASLLCSISDGVSECHDCEQEHAGLIQVNVKNAGTTTTTTYILQVYCGDSWLTTCDQVPSGWQQHPGAFQPDIEYTPVPSATSDSDPDKNYLSFGGGDVEGTLDASFITKYLASTNCNNVDFDMEGSIAGKNGGYDTVQSLAQSVAKTYPDAKFQATCLVNDYTDAEGVMDTFDYFGIMIHGSSMVSGSYSIPEDDPTSGGTYPYIKKWIKSSVPNSKIILSLTTDPRRQMQKNQLCLSRGERIAISKIHFFVLTPSVASLKGIFVSSFCGCPIFVGKNSCECCFSFPTRSRPGQRNKSSARLVWKDT